MEEEIKDVYLIRHAQSTMNVKPELVGGRSPLACLTPLGKLQAKALGQSLCSLGVEFDYVFASPLERAKDTAITVCQEMNFPADRINFLESLEELSQGEWEGQVRKEVYTPAVLRSMRSMGQDFHAPGGESQREAKLRMVEFVKNVVLKQSCCEVRVNRTTSWDSQAEELEGSSPDVNGDDAEATRLKQCRGFLSEPGEKLVLTSESVAAEAQLLRAPSSYQPLRIAVVTHGFAMICLLRGLLGSHQHITGNLSIDNSSVTILRHSTITGWTVVKLNDTSHLCSITTSI